MIRDVYPRSRTPVFSYPGSRGPKSTGSRIPDQDPQQCTLPYLRNFLSIYFSLSIKSSNESYETSRTSFTMIGTSNNNAKFRSGSVPNLGSEWIGADNYESRIRITGNWKIYRVLTLLQHRNPDPDPDHWFLHKWLREKGAYLTHKCILLIKCNFFSL